MSLLEVSGLSKTYTTRFGGAKVEALKSVTFSVESGEYVAVMGESGSGKTTLLNLLAALDRPTGGTVLLGGQNLAEIPEERAAAFRRDHLGFVFQDFSLLDSFSLEDNILLPLVLQGKSRGEMKSRLVPLADRLGIDCDIEADKFRDRALDSGARSADWNAKYRNWLVKGKERGFATPKDSNARRRFTWGSEEVKRVLGPISCEGTDTYMELACKVADLLNQGLDPNMLRRQLANVPDNVLAEQLFEQEAAA